MYIGMFRCIYGEYYLLYISSYVCMLCMSMYNVYTIMADMLEIWYNVYIYKKKLNFWMMAKTDCVKNYIKIIWWPFLRFEIDGHKDKIACPFLAQTVKNFDFSFDRQIWETASTLNHLQRIIINMYDYYGSPLNYVWVFTGLN